MDARLEFPPRANVIRVSAEWFGYVEDITEHEFTVMLVEELTTPEWTESLMATFQRDELNPEESKFLIPGAYIRWSIGYDANGHEAMDLVFNRTCWEAADLERAREEGERMAQALKWQ